MKTAKIAEVLRGEQVESVHQGIIAVVNKNVKILASLGDTQSLSFFRSAARPFQALPVVESGVVVDYAFTLKDIAIIIGSHNGEPEHCEVVSEVLEKIGLSADYLRCGIMPPRHKFSYEQLLIEGVDPSPLHNESSGIHAGMLVLARYLKQPLDDYYLPEHPVQQEIIQCVAEAAGLRPEDIPLGIDSCNVPTFALSIERMAYAYAKLAVPIHFSEVRNTACEIVKAIYSSYPFLLAGTDRFTTDLLKATGSKFIAQDGAEGVYCLGIPDEGIGIAVKIADGNERVIPPVVISLLDQLGFLTAKEKDRLSAYSKGLIYNACNKLVGEIRPAFSIKGAGARAE